MTVDNKQALVNAIAKGDTEPLSKLVNILGGANQAMEFFAHAFAVSAGNDPVKIEAAVIFLVATKKLLERIERQKTGDQILNTITHKIC